MYDDNSHNFTRRAAIGAGAAIAAGIVLNDHMTANAQQPRDKSHNAWAPFDPNDPSITIEFSDLRATLSSGITWLVDQVPSVTCKLSELSNGYSKVLGLTTPSGDKRVVEIDVSGSSVMALTSPSIATAIDTLEAALALYKFSSSWDVYEYTSNMLTRSGDSLVLSGNLVLTYATIAASAETKHKASKIMNSAPTIPTVSLNVSKLIASPAAAVPTPVYDLEHSQPIDGIPKFILDDPNINLFHTTKVTSDGITVYSKSLDVKKLLPVSTADRAGILAALRARLPGINIDMNDVATAVQIATWILGTADEKGKVTLRDSGIRGTIAISFSL
jgi:hypothetical protein